MSSLSAPELRSIRDELAAGGTPTVWFTGSAVGVSEGRSGKVVSLGEPAEGDFIQVRPAGSKDVLSFSAAEVTQVKPARKRSATTAAAATENGGTTTARTGSATRSGESCPAGRTSAETPSTNGKSGVSKASGNRGGAAPSASSGTSAAGGDSGKTPASKASSGKRPARPSGATVTLTADEAGQWTVEVLTGKKRSVRPTQVSPNAVAEAAKALHEDVAAAVEPLIDAAREQQRARVEQLRAELASAEQALDDLAR
ncbi:cell wall anchor protein [Saccharopolyspora sp. HNM0983]|uniref:Cell wall anchor protein n=1 Tax=Saccharopolyspora montiporae TaxID=2781240 RepID=A0A929BCE1_9PSEU|nr:DUF6319 family protein [Saccharopolyspora sp. HNM0983]MBE9375790.1 cell wall anchor protein [Saccharopolyspora sp. HNM0983]